MYRRSLDECSLGAAAAGLNCQCLQCAAPPFVEAASIGQGVDCVGVP